MLNGNCREREDTLFTGAYKSRKYHKTNFVLAVELAGGASKLLLRITYLHLKIFYYTQTQFIDQTLN